MNSAAKKPSIFVPDELRHRKQWLVWKFLRKTGKSKPSKIPYYATTCNLRGWPFGKPKDGEPTDDQPQVEQGHDLDRAHLVDFDEAQAVAAANGMDGIGFAFLPGDGLIGIDLDACINTEDTERRDRASAILKACNSFAEYSPSGNGMHIIVAGESETFKSNMLGIEVFCGRQFFTYTGAHIPGTPDAVQPIDPAVIAKLHKTVKGRTQERPGAPPLPSPPATASKIEDAIRFIDPDCGYDEWLRLGMAIHAELGPEGIAVWDNWSRGGSKYPGVAEIKSHWNSFNGNGITGGTLFKMAMDGGWKPPRVQRCEPAPVASNFTVDQETGEILDAPKLGAVGNEAPRMQSNDNAVDAEQLGPITTWLMKEAGVKIVGRDQEDGVWLVKAGGRDPVHYRASALLRKATLISIMQKKHLNDLVLIAEQGERFTADAAASALLLAANENPVYRAVEYQRPAKQEDDLTGVQGQDSAVLAKKMRDLTLFDVPSQAWFRWDTVWRRINEEMVRKVIVSEVDRALESEFENSYINGTLALLKTRLSRVNDVGSSLGDEIWETDRNLLPMRNGVLDLESRTLIPHSPDYMFNWVIPHSYDQDAECPVTQSFIHRLSGGDVSTESVLYAFLAAVLHGRYDLERYLEFVGMAGTGKSTYISLCKELVGADNVHSTDMRTLHNNQFETANIYGKRLVMISDADKYGGDVGIFKQMTGRDVVRREEKNRQAQSGFIYKGMVIIAANNPIQFADTSTAMARRRVPVHIDKKLDKAEVDYQLANKLAEEIPGLINKLLSISQDEITAVLSDYSSHRRHASMRALVETNAIAAWANENLVASENDISPIGKLGMGHDIFMYPNFAKFCEQTGRKGIVSLNTFTRSLQDVLATAGIEIAVKRKSTGTHIIGVRLRHPDSMDDSRPHLLM